MRPVKIQISLCIRAVWSKYSLGAFWKTKEVKFLRSDNEDSDQTAHMRRLIWVFVERTCQKVRFLTFWLNFNKISLGFCTKTENKKKKTKKKHELHFDNRYIVEHISNANVDQNEKRLKTLKIETSLSIRTVYCAFDIVQKVVFGLELCTEEVNLQTFVMI